jgi:DNA-binding phage protein
MGETKKTASVFREMKWEPGQKEAARAFADKVADSGKTLEQLAESGEVTPPAPWGEVVELLYVAHLLKSAREQQGLSLSDVEKATGMDTAQLSRLESGQGNPTLKTISRYATGLGKQIKLVLEDLAPQDSGVTGSPTLVH